MPAAGAGEQLALSFMSGAIDYDRYIGLTSQCVAVDGHAAAQAFTKLAKDADLRRRMGEAGRQRARAVYDWKVIIRQYQELWIELAAHRKSARQSAGRTETALMYPLRDDPYRIFSDYPTQVLTTDTVIGFSVDEPEKRLQQMLKCSMNNYAVALFLNTSEMEVLFSTIRKHGKVPGEILRKDFPSQRHLALQRTLVWLAKLGIINVSGVACQ